MTKIYYDTEFHERGAGWPIDFISIGMHTEGGRELYAISSEFDTDAVLANPWLVRNVWPHLPTFKHGEGIECGPGHLDRDHPDVRPRAAIARMVEEFVLEEPDPLLVAWYGSYDHVVFAQLWGRMIDLPAGIPMWTYDLRQEVHRLGLTSDDLPEQEEGLHNALVDARHNRVVDEYLDTVRAQRGHA
ncbi:hypothetical protein [Actinomadura nitritigenes]|uniref:hypothetical protein n=1 Tax=Actinomadura nitritigenes TaxID=134602 RepID=UPI003D8BD4B2